MMDVSFARRHLPAKYASEPDDIALQERLDAAEAAVMAYTNNRFPKGLPIDVQMGIVHLVQWDLQCREKQGVASETLSRHSVTYSQLDGESVMGFPKGMMGFCYPYRKARC